ncbi:MAG: prephenate dehydrogenase/arogenate dehydrogenase family protein [Coriobacteriia bacterium]
MSAGGFERIVIIGIGLIGGSVAAALKRLDDPPAVLGIDTNPESVRFAIEHAIVDEAALPGDERIHRWLGPDGADLVILATPARFAARWLQVLAAEGYLGAVTDVTSTKTGILAAARSELPQPSRFLGGHPMAGSERSGIAAARADLFDGVYWLLTPSASTDPNLFSSMHALVTAIGARVISVDPLAHDEAVAIVSHVPHVTAAALVALAAAHSGERGELMRLAAGGFKDTTRIAAGSADLWTGICLDNAEALVAGIEELRGWLGGFETLVRSRDAEAIRAWLAQASEVRRSLPAQWVPASSQLLELAVPMLDRPGVVAEITTVVSHAGGNIEGIDIDHQSEDSAVLVLVLTDEGDMASLVGDLRARGYDPRLTPLETAEEKA